MPVSDPKPSLVNAANTKIPAAGAYSADKYRNPFLRYFHQVLSKGDGFPKNPAELAVENANKKAVTDVTNARQDLIIAAGTYVGYAAKAASVGQSTTQSADAAKALDDLVTTYESYHHLVNGTSADLGISNATQTPRATVPVTPITLAPDAKSEVKVETKDESIPASVPVFQPKTPKPVDSSSPVTTSGTAAQPISTEEKT